MKDFIINILFFGIVALVLFGTVKLSELQFKNYSDFEGLTHEQIVQGVEYTKKHSYNMD